MLFLALSFPVYAFEIIKRVFWGHLDLEGREEDLFEVLLIKGRA